MTGRPCLSASDWFRVWAFKDDPEYDYACSVLETLDGVFVRDIPAIAERARLDPVRAAAAFDRLFTQRCIKYAYFDGGDTPSRYKVTGKTAKRTPLGGQRFRAPTDNQGNKWGRPVGSVSTTGHYSYFSQTTDEQPDIVPLRLRPLYEALSRGDDIKSAIAASGLSADEVSDLMKVAGLS